MISSSVPEGHMYTVPNALPSKMRSVIITWGLVGKLDSWA